MHRNAAIKSPTIATNDWLMWQLADSAFPTGGFAHSGGIEAACQHGYIRSVSDFREFLRQSLHQTINSLVPFLLAAFDDPDAVPILDRRLDAMISNHVTNRASRSQGQAFLATAERTFTIPEITARRTHSLKGSLPSHLPVIFGMVAQTLGLQRSQMIRLFLFITARGMLSAAVRLGVIGPLQAQQLQAEMSVELETLSTQAASLTVDDAAQTAPLIELIQSTQDRLYSRLFQS
jgi:urease accessory protein